MIVDAVVVYWTEAGMRTQGYGDAYLTVREAERLLDEAYRRGWRNGVEAASDVIRETPV